MTFVALGRAVRAALVAASLCCAAAGEARAQSSTPLERFEPVPAGDALFAAPSAGVDAHLAFDAAAMFSLSHSPLALRKYDPERGEYTDAGAIVSHQAVLHLMASGSLFSRLKLDIDLPMTLAQGGTSPEVGGVKVTSPSGFALNDLRIGLRVVAFPAEGYFPGVALSLSTWVPTGDAAAYTSTGSARFEPRLILGADYESVVWSASVGRRLGDPNGGLLGSEVTFAGGIAGRFGRFQIGPELFASAVVDRSAALSSSSLPVSSRAGGSLEALLGAKATLGPAVLGAAWGLGFLRGVGTPDYRILINLAIRPFERKQAPAGWTMFGDEARAASDSPASNGSLVVSNANVKANLALAPATPVGPPDSDGDTVPDAEDACPKVIGDAKPDAKKRGCPPDKDGDGIYDVDDRCPEVPGVVAEGDKNGCPPDKDGDGIIDPEDACPEEAGPKTDDPKTTGCPASVRVVGSQIVILQQVNFETAKARILPVSFSLLQQVAEVMAQHPEIARVAVDGHTDSRGTEPSNLDLSRARAASVMRWLTEKGVDARRLEARGFGPRRPVADNKTEAGRAKNRRVEFQILKRTDKGAAGWVDGPIE